MSDAARLVRRWIGEVWNDRRLDSIDLFVAPDFVGHHEGGETRGVERWKMMFFSFMTAFPDMYMGIEDIIADGERVALRWHATGTHTGPGLPIAPVGRPFDVRGTTWFRVEDGRIAEMWDCWNLDGLLVSLAAPAFA